MARERTVTLLLHVPVTQECVEVATAALVVLNQHVLRRQPSLPWLYESGVRYRHVRGRELWGTIPDVLANPLMRDCKNLAAWRAAELRERSNVKAVTRVKQISDHLMHVVVEWPDGRIEDPSRVLGMGG